MSAAISGPRSRNSEDLKQTLHSPSYCIENRLPCSELLHCLTASKQGESNIRKPTNSFVSNADNFTAN